MLSSIALVFCSARRDQVAGGGRGLHLGLGEPVELALAGRVVRQHRARGGRAGPAPWRTPGSAPGRPGPWVSRALGRVMSARWPSPETLIAPLSRVEKSTSASTLPPARNRVRWPLMISGDAAGALLQVDHHLEVPAGGLEDLQVLDRLEQHRLAAVDLPGGERVGERRPQPQPAQAGHGHEQDQGEPRPPRPAGPGTAGAAGATRAPGRRPAAGVHCRSVSIAAAYPS